MKKYSIYLISIALLVLTFFFFSCQQEETVSVQERIEMFLSDLNSGSRDDIWQNLHDNIDDEWKLADAWSSTPFAISDAPFSLGGPTYGANSADATFGSSNGTYNGDAIHFDLQEDETDVWYITAITVDGIPWIPTP